MTMRLIMSTCARVQELIQDLGCVNTYPWLGEIHKGYVRACLQQAQLENKDALHYVCVEVSPIKRALCSKEAPKNAIKLVPVATNIVLVTDGSKPSGMVCFSESMFEDPRKEKNPEKIAGTGAPVWLAPMGLTIAKASESAGTLASRQQKPSETCIVPYWLVRSTNDSSVANMQHSFLDMSLKVGNGEPMKFRVPVMTSTRKIKVGEELRVYKPVKVEQSRALKKRASSEDDTESGKRAKTVGKPQGKGRATGAGRGATRGRK